MINTSLILKKYKKKGQLSIEFIIIFSIVMILFIFFFIFFSNKYLLIQHKISNLSANEICESVARTINNIYFSEEGVYSKIFLPMSLKNSQNYTTEISNKYLIIEYDNRAESCILSLNNINGTLKKGIYNKIKKYDGGIIIEN